MTNRKPDVEISASVRAKELRFERKPEVEIEIFGEPAVSGGSVSERENLPEELEPGKTYRDFAVHWRLAALLEEDPPADE
jgi:hypothetical protein